MASYRIRVLIAPETIRCSMSLFLGSVPLSNQIFLLLGREVSSSELILANPGKSFIKVLSRDKPEKDF